MDKLEVKRQSHVLPGHMSHKEHSPGTRRLTQKKLSVIKESGGHESLKAMRPISGKVGHVAHQGLDPRTMYNNSSHGEHTCKRHKKISDHAGEVIVDFQNRRAESAIRRPRPIPDSFITSSSSSPEKSHKMFNHIPSNSGFEGYSDALIQQRSGL